MSMHDEVIIITKKEQKRRKRKAKQCALESRLEKIERNASEWASENRMQRVLLDRLWNVLAEKGIVSLEDSYSNGMGKQGDEHEGALD